MGLVTPDYGLLFWMLLSFSIVLFILKKYAWKPILNSLKQREESIEDALNAAKKAKEEMQKLKADNEALLAQARQERDKLLAEAREMKDKIIKEAEIEAQAKANKIIEDAGAEVENLKKQFVSDMKEQIAVISVDIAEKIIRRELAGDNKQKEYVQSLLSDLKLN